MFQRKRKVFWPILLLAIVFAAGCSGPPSAPADQSTGPSSSPEKKDPIKIGAIFPLSGSLALLGTESFEAADLARKIVNEQGGVNGRPVEFIKADAPDATAAANEANRLISKEGVKLIIGTYASGLALAAAPVVERNGVVYYELIASSDKLNQQGFRYVFRVNDNSTKLGTAAVDFVEEALAPRLQIEPEKLKLAVIFEDGAFGTAAAEIVKSRALQSGINLVAYENYKATSVDLSSLVLKLKEVNPDVIIAPSYVNDAVLFQKQAKQYDLNPKAFIGITAGYGLPDLAENLGKDANGIFVVEAPAMVNPEALTEDARKLDEEFRKRWQEMKGRDPAGHAYRGFSGTYALLTQILPNAASVEDSEAIREALLKADIPEGSLPNGWGIKFLPEIDPNAGLNERSFAAIQQWQDEKLVMVWPEKYATTEIKDVPLPPWKDRNK